MTILQRASLACTIGCATFSLASSASKARMIIPDNVVSCQSCTIESHDGRNYKVLSTSQFTVMVSLSDSGDYTRADVSIANNTGLPLSVTPDDFRIEVSSGKQSRVLLYVPPSAIKPPATAETLPPPAPDNAKDLPAATLAPSQTLSGRVFFESAKTSPHDKKAHQVKVVVPIAGEVFEFPYSLKPAPPPPPPGASQAIIMK